MTIPRRAVALAVFIHVLWGGIPTAAKIGFEVFPPLSSAFIRFFIGAAIIGLWARTQQIRIWPSPAEWPVLLLVSVVFAIQNGLMYAGVNLTRAAVASVLITTYPLFAAGFAHLFIPGDRLSARKGIGLAVAASGAIVVLLQRAGAEGLQIANPGNWIVLASSALIGARFVLAARVVQRIDPARLLVWQMVLALPLFGVGAMGWETIQWANLAWPPVVAVAYQGVVVAGFAFLVSHYLIKAYTPSVVVSFGFVTPISGVLLGAFILSDPVGPGFAIGLVAVAAGLYLIARG